jgi:hypothetical protein
MDADAGDLGDAAPDDGDAGAWSDAPAEATLDDASADGVVVDALVDTYIDPSATTAFECCAAFLNGALPPDAGFATYFADEAARAPSLTACSRSALDYLDREEYVDPSGYADDRAGLARRGALFSCCVRLDFQAGASCSAWGPPAPTPAVGAPSFAGAPTRLDLRTEARAAMPRVPWLPALAGAARATWARRMVKEHSSARVFEAIAAQLEGAGFDPMTVEECRGFAAEERRHGVLCGAVVEALGGEACAHVGALPAVPAHEDVDAREAVLRNLLSVSCLSETLAVALIAAERFDMPEGDLRALLTGIWRDEIGHARFGWRLVAEAIPALDEHARARLEAYLATAFAHLEAHMLEHLPLSEHAAEGAALGLCSGRRARELVHATLTEVVAGRLEALGLRAHAAWRDRKRAA